MNQRDFDADLMRLADERRKLQALRTDYEALLRSRFHALRMLWLSLKAFLGFASPRDRYAAWSVGMSTFAPPAAQNRLPGSPDSSHAERHLLASWTARAGARSPSVKPAVTVVVPVFNQLATTVRCLQSLADTWSEHVGAQVVVVDDGSTDRTPDVVSTLPGIDYAKGPNQGFVRACNRGLTLARGKYVCFLNNDTIARDGWLDYLVLAAESDASIGAVGSKLIYPDGTLQEAGGIIWRDATGNNYGRHENPAEPRFNYRRDVDYCSGAALMVRRDVLERLAGFSEEFAPAYYEDADLCFSVRKLGFRVVYQPRSEVVHDEGTTSGTDLTSGAKRFQEINRPKFAQKWATALQSHYDNDRKNVEPAARRIRRKATVLVIDTHVPMYDRDAGSSRLMRLIQTFLDAGYHVIFLPDNFAALQPYTAELQDLGVEVLFHRENGKSLGELLDGAVALADLAWICRPDLFTKYEPLVRKNASIRILYDTIDLHFIRSQREAELRGGGAREWQQIERQELGAAAKADATVVVTEAERKILMERGVENVFVVPTLHDVEVQGEREFAGTSGLLFIGGYNHPPNGDAVKWLCDDIMPLVWNEDPSIELTLLGSNPPEAVTHFRSDRVHVPGYVRDVAPYFMKSRLFVAPLRFGAGMNGKVGHALAYGLPVVTTSRGAEGFDLRDGQDCLIAGDPKAFAAAVLRVYRDRELWSELSRASLTAIAPFQTRAVAPRVIATLETVARLRKEDSLKT